MSFLSQLNDVALDGYLRGEHGESMRREAQQVLYERGRQAATMSVDDMIKALQEQGYGILSPADLELERRHNTCPWCGHAQEE